MGGVASVQSLAFPVIGSQAYPVAGALKQAGESGAKKGIVVDE